ncbi:MAG: hypothetical protein E7475_07920 [Ruminococcaceae bacterium]|nr:hypothetical protein [Oscillospiraceae bacterium]
MAKAERNLHGDFLNILNTLTDGILNGSVSATLEDESFFKSGSALCAVRVFERYSFSGSNRVSMTLTLFQGGPDEPIQLSAITAGGSQATFFKLNTWGEEAFLDKLLELLD